MQSIRIRRGDFTRIKIYGPITVALIMCIPGYFAKVYKSLVSIGSPCTDCKKRMRTLSIQTTKKKRLYIHEEGGYVTETGGSSTTGIGTRIG